MLWFHFPFSEFTWNKTYSLRYYNDTSWLKTPRVTHMTCEDICEASACTCTPLITVTPQLLDSGWLSTAGKLFCPQTLKSGPADVSQNYTVGMSATCEMLTACFVARFGAKPWTISSPGVIRIQSQSWLSHGCSSAIYPQESNTSAAVVTLLWIQPPSKGPPSGLQRDLTPQRNNLQSS